MDQVIRLCATRNIWNETGFRPPLCTYRLNWARRTSGGWWDDWDDTVLQTQDSKFEPWRSEAEHATSRSRWLPTILTFTRGWGRNIFCFFQTAETGNRTPNSGVKSSGANHYPRAPALAQLENQVGNFFSQWSVIQMYRCALLRYALPRDVDPMMCKCWVSVADAAPTLTQHCVNVSFMLGEEF